MAGSFNFEDPDLFTAGALGDPGQRVFFLQIREGDTVVSLKCEKQQVGALVEYLSGVLADLPPAGDVLTDIDMTHAEPVVAEWIAGTMGVAYDESTDRVVLVVEQLTDPEEVDPEPARLRVQLERPQVAAFVEHARALVEAGRPPCPLCGQPLDPAGHVCPRTNGHRAVGPDA
jgi:uncharacterized repeat protein (TIGR03847 family)